jgi:hypothetical protein
MDEPLFPADLSALRAWVEENAADAGEVWLGFHRVRFGAPLPPRAPRVYDAAQVLADAGWVEAGRRDVDGDRYAVRFAPGRVKRAARVTPDGPFDPPALSDEYAERLRSDPAAAAFFAAQSPKYQRTAIWWVMSGKAEETRERRITALVEACAAGERIAQLQRQM